MKYQDFEKNIRAQFHNAEEAVDTSSLLGALGLTEEPKTVKKPWFGYVLGLALAVILSSMIYLYFSSESGGEVPQLSSIANSMSSTSQPAPGLVEEKMEEPKNSPQKIVTNDTEETTKTNEHIEEGSNQQQGELPAEQALAAAFTTATTNNSIENTIATPNTQITQAPQASSNTIVDFSTAASKNVEVAQFATTDYSSSSIEAPNTAAATTVNQSSIMLTALEQKNQELSFFRNIKNDKIVCPSFKRGSGFSLAIVPEVGVFLPLKSLSQVGSETTEAFVQREANESSLEGLEAGLHLMVTKNNLPFYAKIGASYGRLTERMNLSYEYTEMDTTIGIISTTVSSTGDTITNIYGDIITETTYTGNTVRHYSLRQFNIPLAIGYRMPLNSFTLGIEGGVNFNISQSAKGNVFQQGSDFTDLDNTALFESSVGVSFFGGFTIGKQIGKLGELYVSPRFRYFPGDFSNGSQGITQNYSFAGLHVGLIYWL